MMKNIYEVIEQKQRDIERVKREIEILRAVVPMLEEDGTAVAGRAPTPGSGGTIARRD